MGNVILLLFSNEELMQTVVIKDVHCKRLCTLKSMHWEISYHTFDIIRLSSQVCSIHVNDAARWVASGAVTWYTSQCWWWGRYKLGLRHMGQFGIHCTVSSGVFFVCVLSLLFMVIVKRHFLLPVRILRSTVDDYTVWPANLVMHEWRRWWRDTLISA